MIERVDEELDLLDRHLEVLSLVARHQPIGILELARRTGHPRHRIRYSLGQLEDRGLVEPTRQGATTTPETRAFVDEHGVRFDSLARRLQRLANRTEVPA